MPKCPRCGKNIYMLEYCYRTKPVKGKEPKEGFFCPACMNFITEGIEGARAILSK